MEPTKKHEQLPAENQDTFKGITDGIIEWALKPLKWMPAMPNLQAQNPPAMPGMAAPVQAPAAIEKNHTPKIEVNKNLVIAQIKISLKKDDEKLLTPEEEKGISKLIGQLRDDEFETRQRASAALEKKYGRKVIPALEKALKNDDAEVRRRAQEVLAVFKSAEDDRKTTLKISLEQLREIKWTPKEAKELVPLLVKALKEDDAVLKSDAIKTLGHMGPEAKAAIPALIDALKDKDENVRRAAASAFFSPIGQGAEEAVPALMNALKDKNEHVRSLATLALGYMKSSQTEKIVPALIAVLKDKQETPLVKLLTAESLGRQDPKATMPALIGMLKDKDQAASYAIDVLVNIAPKATAEAKADIINALNEFKKRGEDEAKKAEEAIKAITNPMKPNENDLPPPTLPPQLPPVPGKGTTPGRIS